MKHVTFVLTGTSPLMVNNPQTVNPFNDYTKAMKEITGKRKRSDQDEEELMKLKWMAALYYDARHGPFLPAVCVWRSIQEAAKVTKAGRTVERGLHMTDQVLPIVYDGPRDPEALYRNKAFVDIRDAAPNGKRVTVVRPIFPSWMLSAPFLYDPTLLNDRDLLSYVESAGRIVGIGTYRRMFGRFAVEVQ